MKFRRMVEIKIRKACTVKKREQWKTKAEIAEIKEINEIEEDREGKTRLRR